MFTNINHVWREHSEVEALEKRQLGETIQQQSRELKIQNQTISNMQAGDGRISQLMKQVKYQEERILSLNQRVSGLIREKIRKVIEIEKLHKEIIALHASSPSSSSSSSSFASSASLSSSPSSSFSHSHSPSSSHPSNSSSI
jgi:hypothetical protein